MKHYSCSSAICPFYKYESVPTVYCRGFTDDMTIHLAFVTRDKALAYKKGYCRSGYRQCPIYKILEEIYEEQVRS